MKKDLSEMTLEELWELFPIILKEHNPDYKEWYLTEKENIIKSIGSAHIERINHIGSSAVKGLISKPTVDILVEINKDCGMENLKTKLKNSGWVLMSFEKEPELRMVFCKGYTKDGFAKKVYHLHVRNHADWNELYFRDYLIAHKDVADEYGKLKLNLWKQYEHNRDGFTEAKTQFIEKYTSRAKKEFEGKYLPNL